MRPNPQFPADLITFTEETLIENFSFCGVNYINNGLTSQLTIIFQKFHMRGNTERYSVSLYIQATCGKIRTRITPNMDTLRSDKDMASWQLLKEKNLSNQSSHYCPRYLKHELFRVILFLLKQKNKVFGKEHVDQAIIVNLGNQTWDQSSLGSFIQHLRTIFRKTNISYPQIGTRTST